MVHYFKHLTLTLLCLGATNAVLASQPGTSPDLRLTAPRNGSPMMEKPVPSALKVGVMPGKVSGSASIPATVTSITLSDKALTGAPMSSTSVVIGAPTLLKIIGTGSCKYRLSYVKKENPQAAQPLMTFSNSTQSPFNMIVKIFDATPGGTYTWTVNGIEGCQGSATTTFTAQ